MIVKFLSKSPAFGGVGYNTKKIDKDLGELVGVRNFGALEAMAGLTQRDFVNYLKAVSSQNKRVKLPQLHVAISAKQRSFSKEELIQVADEWMKRMGYGENPYMLVFHKDTANNHLHIVSTRVDKHGKKIDSAFERVRGVREMNEMLGVNETLKARDDLDKLLDYAVGTKAQFYLLFERLGYTVAEKDGQAHFIKYGKKLASLELTEVQQHLGNVKQDEKRIKQITAVFQKYKLLFDGRLEPVHQELPGGQQGAVVAYASPLTAELHRKFGLEIVFHFKDAKMPYGYTIIDHSHKAVYKGGSIMPLEALTMGMQAGKETQKQLSDYLDKMKENAGTIDDLYAYLKGNQLQIKGRKIIDQTGQTIHQLPPGILAAIYGNTQKAAASHFQADSIESQEALAAYLRIPDKEVFASKVDPSIRDYYASLLRACRASGNYEDALREFGLETKKIRGTDYLVDPSRHAIVRLEGLLPEESARLLPEHDAGREFRPKVHGPRFDIAIADDIDDEQILGRNRRKKRKARTNTR